jgi:cell division protein FtsQ
MKFKIIIIVCVVIAAIAQLLFSPLFLVSESDLTIKGNVHIKKEDVVNAVGLGEPTNILLINTARAKAKLSENKYCNSLEFNKKLPNKLIVTINEHLLSGYVPFLDSFLCVDSKGRVLQTTKSVDEDLPVIEGLNFSGFSLGEVLATDNPAAYDAIVKIIRILEKYELTDNFVERINVSNLDDIHLFIYNVDIAFGSTKDADEKIRTIKEIMSKLPNASEVAGILDMREIGRQYIFKVLT